MKALVFLTTLTWASFTLAKGLTSIVELEDGRQILTDANNRTVYTFDVDGPNDSNCHGRCLAVWPPITVAKDIEVLKPFGVIITDEGIRQLTLKEKPLYHFVSDSEPLDIRGDNLGGTWHIVELNFLTVEETDQEEQTEK